MSVTSAALIHRQGSIDRKGIETYVYTFLVISDQLNESEVVVANAVGIPALWSSHPFNANARCTSKNIDQDTTDFMRWTVTVTYDTEPFEVGSTSDTQGETSQQTPPDDRPPVIKYSSNIVEEPLEEDFTEPTPKKLVNSAGVPFDPLPTVEVPIIVISITDWSTTYDPITKTLYEGRVNNDAVSIGGIEYGPGRLLCRKLDGNSQFENASGKVWQRDVEIWFHPNKTWDDLKLLDCGTVAFIPDVINPIPSQLTDDSGAAVTQPVPLDGEGHKLDSTDPDDFVYLEFKKRKNAAFVGVFGVAP